MILIVMLFICALNAKEMAITLPAALLLYELVYNRPKLIFASVMTWCWRDLRLVWLLAALAVPFAFGKLSPDSAFSHNGSYLLNISPHSYIAAYARYLDGIFYRQPGWFTNIKVPFLFVAMLFVAFVTRRKELWFSSVFVLFSVLPVIFIEVRGSIFVLYIPFFGFVLYAATLLILIRTATCTYTWWNGAMLSAVTFALAAICLGIVHKAHTGTIAIDRIIQPTVEQIHEIFPLLAPNSSLLLVGDPFKTDE